MDEHTEYIKVATVRQLHENRGKLVTVDGTDIALFKREGKVFALGNVCAHQHFSVLHQGEINELTVACPMHGWRYDLTNGNALNGNGKVRWYAVKIEQEDIYIAVPKIKDMWPS